MRVNGSNLWKVKVVLNVKNFKVINFCNNMKNEMTETFNFTELGDCRYCHNSCEGEHGFSDEEGFVNICDDCLNDKLAKKELLQ